MPPIASKFRASHTVTLGRTGIQTSRWRWARARSALAPLATRPRLACRALAAVLLNGYDQGLRFFDAADSYAAIRTLPKR